MVGTQSLGNLISTDAFAVHSEDALNDGGLFRGDFPRYTKNQRPAIVACSSRVLIRDILISVASPAS